jgi:hypothetical protein
MHKHFPRVAVLLSLLFVFGLAQPPLAAQAAPTPNAQLAGKELNAKVDKLLKQMTLEEKIGQLVQFSAGFATGPAGSKISYDELVQQGRSAPCSTSPERNRPTTISTSLWRNRGCTSR